MMKKIIVNAPSGEQEIIEVGNGGGYFDQSRVVWDERVDGDIPGNVVLGKMSRSGNTLVELESFLPEHEAAKDAEDQKKIAVNVAKLWAAADAYIYATINGVALSILALGVHHGKPKALAVAAWCDAVWAEYYTRRATVTADDEPNLDFSALGDKPYTVLELREEVSESWAGTP